MAITPVQATDLVHQVEQLAKENQKLEDRLKRVEADQYGTFSFTINRRPKLEKYTCGLVDPESKLINKMVKNGCVPLGATPIGKKHARYSFRKKL